MITLDNIVKGEAKDYRVTFMNADNQAPLDCEGWTLHLGIGSNRSRLNDILEVFAVGDNVTGQHGRITVALSAEATQTLDQPAVFVEVSVDTGSGSRQPLLLGTAKVLSPEHYRQQYYQSTAINNQILNDTPVIVQGVASQPQHITMQFSTDLDPTFDIGVLVRFSEVSPEITAYIADTLVRAEAANVRMDGQIDEANDIKRDITQMRGELETLETNVTEKHGEVITMGNTVTAKHDEVVNMHSDVTNMYDVLVGN